jgi:zinc transport system ATP-binding protein
VFIARALMGNPELLVFDEPSAGVDNQSQTEIYSLIKSVNRSRRISVLSVEHNLKAAIDNSTLIFHLSGGHGHLCRPDEYIDEFISANRGGDGDATI